MKTATIRPPAVAGMFYPVNRNVLEPEIEQLLDQASVDPMKETIVALISPHAGYQYSGPTAANGFKLLKDKKFDSVVIVSPSHREYFDGISVYDGSAYRTPLGTLSIDESLRQELLNNETLIQESALGHGQEHGVEVQLPFIQKTLGEIKILPIVMGDQRREYCFHLGDKLADVLKGKNALLIASTDLSHYYPYDIAMGLDNIIIDDIERFNYEQMMTDLESERAEACGGGPTVAVLVAARKLGANQVRILHHCNSGDITGDHSGVVGYLSAVVFRTN
jgi:AmmeMemoRadiSam system protein B